MPAHVNNSPVNTVSSPKKLSLIAFSGDFDRLTALFTLATGAAAVGYRVNIFFTFWGLNAVKVNQGRSFVGNSFLTRLFSFIMGGIKKVPCSRLNLFGLGPCLFRHMMRKNNVATLEELVEAAKQLGVHFYVCEMAMRVLGLESGDFVHQVEDVLGVASFLRYSEDGQVMFV